MRTFIALGGALSLVCAIGARAAAADPVVDAFYGRCVSESSYRMAPADLANACGCMAPVLVSFLTDEAYRQVEGSIKGNKPVTFGGTPFKGEPSDPARSAIA
ncbi:MAG: hypothetical protein ACREEP_08060 [Dongiaceae bacterium]